MKKSFVLLLLTIISISSQSTNRYSLLVVTIQDDNKTLFSIDSGEDLCQSTNKNPEHRYCWRTEDRRNRKCLSNGEGVLRQKSKETREATPYDRSKQQARETNQSDMPVRAFPLAPKEMCSTEGQACPSPRASCHPNAFREFQHGEATPGPFTAGESPSTTWLA